MHIELKPRNPGWSTLAKEIHDNGFAITPSGPILSPKFLSEIKAASIQSIADAFHDMEAKGDPTYPADHKAAMRVPKGGSSCASCKYVSDDGKDCSNTHYQAYNGSKHLPAPADEYCSDWYEPKEEIKAEGVMDTSKGWHGVDLDGTIAYHKEWKGPEHIGKPINGEALAKVKEWLKKGEKVKIFSARAKEPKAIKPIEDFCMKVFGQKLEITDRKDENMIDMLDDRAFHVEENTGKILGYGTSEGVEKEWDTRGRGRKQKEVYQGTLGKLADKIIKEGLKPGTPLRGIKMVWATKDKEEALGYGISKVADAKTGDQIALVVIDPVKANFSQAYKDMNMQYVVSKGAPPESIKRIEIYDRDALYAALNDYRDIDTLKRAKDLPIPKPVRIIKSEANEIYLTLVADSSIEAASETSGQDTLWHGITFTGFTGPEEEALRAVLSRIPPELLVHVECIVSAPELNAKHGRYLSGEHKILFNPGNLNLRQRFGGGELPLNHTDLCLVHEVGHSLYNSLTSSEKTIWLGISGWTKNKVEGQAPAYVERRPGWEPKTSEWTHKFGVKFSRYYGEKNPDEDFADCFAFFLMNKAYRIGRTKRLFFEKFVNDHVNRYPHATIQSPIHAYGTSEGVEKSWDTRGRGHNYLETKTGKAEGTNPGGFYKGSDGIDRYVKFYKDQNQGKCEVLANEIYRDLGIGAPKSTVFETPKGEAFASEIIPDSKELNAVKTTPELARKIMDGFAADVLTANWDAVGLEHDNIRVKDDEPYRVDNGGSFLFRAMASSGRKPDNLLANPTEVKGFFNPSINDAYLQVAQKAGYNSHTDLGHELERQVSKITALEAKSGGWDKYVDDKMPSLKGADRGKVVGMLIARTAALKKLAGINASAGGNHAGSFQASEKRQNEGHYNGKGVRSSRHQNAKFQRNGFKSGLSKGSASKELQAGGPGSGCDEDVAESHGTSCGPKKSENDKPMPQVFNYGYKDPNTETTTKSKKKPYEKMQEKFEKYTSGQSKSKTAILGGIWPGGTAPVYIYKAMITGDWFSTAKLVETMDKSVLEKWTKKQAAEESKGGKAWGIQDRILSGIRRVEKAGQMFGQWKMEQQYNPTTGVKEYRLVMNLVHDQAKGQEGITPQLQHESLTVIQKLISNTGLDNTVSKEAMGEYLKSVGLKNVDLLASCVSSWTGDPDGSQAQMLKRIAADYYGNDWDKEWKDSNKNTPANDPALFKYQELKQQAMAIKALSNEYVKASGMQYLYRGMYLTSDKMAEIKQAYKEGKLIPIPLNSATGFSKSVSTANSFGNSFIVRTKVNPEDVWVASGALPHMFGHYAKGEKEYIVGSKSNTVAYFAPEDVWIKSNSWDKDQFPKPTWASKSV
jgi:hypothetical protein